MYEISFELNGTVYDAMWDIIDGLLVVTFPDGSQREIYDNGLFGVDGEHSEFYAMQALKAYARQQDKKSSQ